MNLRTASYGLAVMIVHSAAMSAQRLREAEILVIAANLSLSPNFISLSRPR